MNEPSLIKIYQSCSILMNTKRKLFALLNVQQLESSNQLEQKITNSSKVYMCLKKISKQVKNTIRELSSNQNKQNHIIVIDKIVNNLKNNNQFLTQQQKLILQVNKIIETWNQTTDPLVYYEQQERSQLKKIISDKLSDINTCAIACRETKKPLYARKLQRQLKDNLILIAQNQRNYNIEQYNTWIDIRKKSIKLIVKIIDAAKKRQRDTFVQDEKNLLLGKYIDVFHGKQHKIADKTINQYRKDLTLSLTNLQEYFQQEQVGFEELCKFLQKTDQQMKNFSRQYFRAQDQIPLEIYQIFSEINNIVNFEQILSLIHTAKKYVITLFEWTDFRSKACGLRKMIQDSIVLINDYLKEIRKRQYASKNVYVEQFIEDKKFLQNYTKRQVSFQNNIFDALITLLQKSYKNCCRFEHKHFQNQQQKKNKFQNSITQIFQNYFNQTQKNQRSESSRRIIEQNKNLSINQKKQVVQIQNFINKLVIYEKEQQMNDCYQCSLGPRLLIHGRIKLLPQGILYLSSFNKKNLFFGRTKIFIPKQQIFQINKQSAFVIFPDVIEIITKKGGIYFHALGKRERMYQEFNNFYFPQINLPQSLTAQLQFNQFKGDKTILQNRIQPHMQSLQSEAANGQIPNISIRNFFNKYFSDSQFIYQGITYQNFNYFSIDLAGGTNTKGTNYTPGIPYYFKLKNQTKDQSDDIIESQRFFTYKKEVPMIPFVSKGGFGICHEKSVYRWGGPFCFVVDNYTTLSGFSPTDGMQVQTRFVFQQKQGKVLYKITAGVTFETNTALSGMLRSPVLSNLRGFLQILYQRIKKIQKNKKPKKAGSKNHTSIQQAGINYEQRIQQLQKQNKKLKRNIKLFAFITVIIYIITSLIVFMII